jgi:hypothetical protein
MAEKVVIDLEVDVQKSERTLGQLEDRATELNEELRKVPLGSKAFNELKNELVGVNKEIKNTELAMESLDNEQVASELGSVAGAVGDVTAAFILLGGDEDSAIGETAKRIETALGVTMAFKGTIEGVISFQKLWNNTIKKTAVVQGILTASQTAYNFVVQGTTLVTKALRLALLSLPFVAIGTAIAGLIAYWDDLVSGIKSGLKWLGLYDDSEEQAQARAKARLKEERKLRQQRLKQLENSAKREQEIHNNRIANLDNEIRLAKAQGKNTVELERQKLNIIIESTKQQNKLAEERIALQKEEINLEIARLEGLGSLTSKLQKADEKLVNLKQKILDLDQEQIESTQAVQNAETDLLVFEAETTQERRTQRTEDNKEKEEQRKKEEQALFDLQIARDARQKAEALINIENLKLQKELENKELSDAEKELLQFEHQERIAELSQQAIDKELEQEQAKADAQAEIDKKAAEDKKALDEENLQRQIDLENAKLDLAQQGIDSLMALTNAFAKDNEKSQRRAFEINKKLQIAQALIATYQGANQAFATTAANPLSIANPSLPFIAAAAAVAQGLANVATIAKQQFQGGSAGGGGTTTAPNFGAGETAPTIAPVTNTSTLIGQEPQQVFVTETDITNVQNQVVTETDITNVQNQVAVIETQATIK